MNVIFHLIYRLNSFNIPMTELLNINVKKLVYLRVSMHCKFVIRLCLFLSSLDYEDTMKTGTSFIYSFSFFALAKTDQ